MVDAGGGQDFNQAMVRLDAVGYWPKTGKTPQAKVTIFEDTPNRPREKQIRVKHGTVIKLGVKSSLLTLRSDFGSLNPGSFSVTVDAVSSIALNALQKHTTSI